MVGSHAHLIGIGGNGMHALAEVLRGWGWSVSGSDAILPSPLGRGAGGEGLFHGHAAEYLPLTTDIVIHSDAIPPDNPELCRAAELGIPILSYFQALGKITSVNDVTRFQEPRPPMISLAFAGTHGKSSTTAMAAYIFTQSGRAPTVFCGATPIGEKTGGRAGRKDFIVVEACEYRKNFLHLRPTHAAILGIEPDHFDCFENLAEIELAFRQLAESLPPQGRLLYREDCPSTQKVVENLGYRKQSFGFSPAADWSAQNLHSDLGCYHFSIFNRGEFVLEVQLPIPGRYNILNALAAAAMCWENECTAEQIRHGLATFPGLHRRFEIGKTDIQSIMKSRQAKNLSCVMDYAHHPTEVTAALQTAREVFPNRRIWCIFQPHQASRTTRLLDELAFSLQNADKLLVADIFRAREGVPKLGEATAADLARRAAEIAKTRKEGVEVLPTCRTNDIIDILATQLQSDDVIITLGAGDIHSVLGLGS
jgi:UDP-N-acetylmuramate--alanine ligase